MKTNHVVVLKQHTKNGVVVISQLAELLTVTDACKRAEALNKINGFVCGGFGQWYAAERAA